MFFLSLKKLYEGVFMISIEKKVCCFFEKRVYKKKMWSEKKDHERKK